MKTDLNKTLEQLEKNVWLDPGHDSYLVMTVYQLRKKPLKDFTIEDLRITIGQNMSLEYLMPIALKELKKNILAEGHFNPGDLLSNVLTVDINYWKKNENEWRMLRELVHQNKFRFTDKEFAHYIKTIEQTNID